jgi:hypothetical protein
MSPEPGSRAGSFWTELAAGSSRAAYVDSSASTSWLGLTRSGSSFLLARLEPDRVGSRPGLPPTDEESSEPMC